MLLKEPGKGGREGSEGSWIESMEKGRADLGQEDLDPFLPLRIRPKVLLGTRTLIRC